MAQGNTDRALQPARLSLLKRLRLVSLALVPFVLLAIVLGLGFALARVAQAPSPTPTVHKFYAGLAQAPADDTALERALQQRDDRVVHSITRRPKGGFAAEYSPLAMQEPALEQGGGTRMPWSSELRVVFERVDPNDVRPLLPRLLDEHGYQTAVWGYIHEYGTPERVPPRLPGWLQVVLPLVAIGMVLALVRWQRARFVPLPSPLPRRRVAVLSALVLLAVVAASALANLVLFPVGEQEMLAYRAGFAELLFADGRTPGVASALFIIVLMPLAEELVFRKWMLTFLAAAMPAALAVASAAALFVAMHGASHTGLVVALAVHGVLLGWLWMRTRSLAACWSVHAGNNALAFIPWLLPA